MLIEGGEEMREKVGFVFEAAEEGECGVWRP